MSSLSSRVPSTSRTELSSGSPDHRRESAARRCRPHVWPTEIGELRPVPRPYAPRGCTTTPAWQAGSGPPDSAAGQRGARNGAGQLQIRRLGRLLDDLQNRQVAVVPAVGEPPHPREPPRGGKRHDAMVQNRTASEQHVAHVVGDSPAFRRQSAKRCSAAPSTRHRHGCRLPDEGARAATSSTLSNVTRSGKAVASGLTSVVAPDRSIIASPTRLADGERAAAWVRIVLSVLGVVGSIGGARLVGYAADEIHPGTNCGAVPQDSIVR